MKKILTDDKTKGLSRKKAKLKIEMPYQECNLNVVLGTNENSNMILCNLDKHPHLLIAGQRKGVDLMMYSLKNQLLYSNTKCNYLSITLNNSETSIDDILKEIDYRLALFENKKVCKISEYNDRYKKDILRTIFVFIDDLKEAINLYSKEVIETIVKKICARGRSLGIHLVIATTDLDKDILSSTILLNIVTKITFRTATSNESMMILNKTGAEKLIYDNDFLYCDQFEANLTKGKMINLDITI